MSDSVHDLLYRAAQALESEIESVRKKPSTDILFNGVKIKSGNSKNGYDYKFETHQSSIRYAEEIKSHTGEKEWMAKPVSYENNEIILQIPDDAGDQIDKLHVEWENDFVLRKTLHEIDRLSDAPDSVLKRIEKLFDPEPDAISANPDIHHDGLRNQAQEKAIRKALTQQSLFIWGPPGTGKTDTLGYIIANYLASGKSVLFASNTNRAVDIGLLSSINALKQIGQNGILSACTRFGEAALDHDGLEEFLFETQIQIKVNKKREQASEWIDLLRKQQDLKERIASRLQDGKQATNNQELELKLVDQKIKNMGGQEALEELIAEHSSINEAMEMRNKQFIATTLAKVCTSDLFHDLDFDAVVIDEGSMANLPFLMVLASRAKWHRIVVGDPMQLPPISVTDDRESREFLEKDIFTTVSEAGTTEELFNWHDQNPEITQFFDTQYRLAASLAEVISSVFYDGRLQTADGISKKQNNPVSEIDRAFHLVDTSRYGASLTQKEGESGFKPVNEIHQDVIERLILNMTGKGIRTTDIGVIVPFRSPVYDIRNRLYEAGIRDVEVGTIHTFQGREKPYIIFDTVMSGEKQRNGIRHYSVRPLDEEKNGLSVPRLLNVAFSRSKKELVVLADMAHVKHVYGNKFLFKLLSNFEK